MKTLFSLGLPGSFDFWNPPAPAMGQADVPVGSLTDAQHTDILGRLKAAMAKVLEMDTWIHSIGDDQQAAILGDAYADFRLDVDFLAGLYTDVYPDYQQIDTTNTEDWWIPDLDAWKVSKFLSTTDHAYQIFTQKTKGVYPQTPVVNAVPVTPGSKPPTPQRLPATARPASTGILPPSKVLGIPTNTLLIGGGVAVGLGVLLYALR